MIVRLLVRVILVRCAFLYRILGLDLEWLNIWAATLSSPSVLRCLSGWVSAAGVSQGLKRSPDPYKAASTPLNASRCSIRRNPRMSSSGVLFPSGIDKAGLPPPGGWNLAVWVTLLSENRQQRPLYQ